jgi:heat shock protein HtpX
MEARTHARLRADCGYQTNRLSPAWRVITVAPLGLRHAAFGAALLVSLGSWIPVLAIATTLLAVQYWFSDRIALSAMRAEAVGPEEEPRLYAIFTRLCAQADMPKPTLAITDSETPNAYAAGRTPAHAVLCVTTGLTRHLTDDELEAVLARELSRLAHRDTIVITVAPLMPLLAGLLTRAPFHTSPLGTTGFQTDPTLGAALTAITLLAYTLGFLLVWALSRYRELAADHGGAILTGHPTALGHALVKLDTAGTTIPTTDLRTPTAPDDAPVITRAAHRGRSLLSTHPDLATRLDRLAKLTTALEGR